MTLPLLHAASQFAAIKHHGQWRKNGVPQIPYIAHPMGVAFILMREGYSDEVVAAGLLHDVIEDCEVTLEDLHVEFGERVASLVSEVTELPKTVSWQERKIAYREALLKADPEGLAVSVADHLHNLRSLSAALQVETDVLSKLHDISDKVEHEKACADIYRDRLPGSLTDIFTKELSEFTAQLKDQGLV